MALKQSLCVIDSTEMCMVLWYNDSYFVLTKFIYLSQTSKNMPASLLTASDPIYIYQVILAISLDQSDSFTPCVQLHSQKRAKINFDVHNFVYIDNIK